MAQNQNGDVDTEIKDDKINIERVID